MEITIKIDGDVVSVKVSTEVWEVWEQGKHKAENLTHEKRRHWDDREFDEYIVATEGHLPYQPTPEDIVCQRETLSQLLSILDSCTAIQRERFLLYALYGYTHKGDGAIAIFHCSVKIIKRSTGRSSVAAVTYRSGEKLTNEWDGMTHDYTRKSGIVYTEIMLPTHAPSEFSD